MSKKKTFPWGFDVQFVHEKTGIPVPSIYRHANGESIPRLDIAMKYHEGIGISFEEILAVSKGENADQLHTSS